MNDPLVLILGACVLDALFGDPVYRLHPIRLIGAWSLACERVLFARALTGRFGGLVHWVLVVGAALGVWFGVRSALTTLHPALPLIWDLFIAYSLLCTRELLEQGWRLCRELDDLPAARRRLAYLVGRDTDCLQRDGLVRATLESLSENLTDGVLTPLWALCLFGLPGLIVVKAISTLDSMVGYKNARYAHFGWAGARSDDLIHWLPARLSVPLLALAAALRGEHPSLAMRAAWRYHALLPSPNSGWSEAACAGALRVRLIGPVWRQGQLVTETYMGDPDWPADLSATDLERGLWLMLVACGVALGLGLVMHALLVR